MDGGMDLVVIGGGVIGLELGMVYQKLGTKITVIELMDPLLPGPDLAWVPGVRKRPQTDGRELHWTGKAGKTRTAIFQNPGFEAKVIPSKAGHRKFS